MLHSVGASLFLFVCVAWSFIATSAAQPPAVKPARLLKIPGFLQHLTWSPDGKKFLFTRGNYAGKMGLWTVNSDGAELTQLLPKAPVPQFDGSWSPDSKRLIFV
jgi:Tol biopolymer transport system component